MSDKTNKSKDRFQLAWRHTSVNIKVGGKAHPLETRLHLIYYDRNILLNVLFLTSTPGEQEGWLVGFDPIADKICRLRSKLEIALAINCLLDSVRFAEILVSGIDMSSCRNLIKDITCKSKDKAKESLLKLCDLLNINVLTDESAMSNDLPVQSKESSPILQGEALSLKLRVGSQELTDGLLSMLRIGGQRAEDSLLLTLDIRATSNLSKVDYNDDIRLEIDVGKGLESIFGGKINEVDCLENNELAITCRSHILTLEDTIIPGLLMRVSGGAEKIYYILRDSGWPPEKLSIDGLDIGDRKRFCAVLTPIANVEADKPFGIGDVTFMKLEQEYKDAMRSLNPKSNPSFPKLDEDRIWARVYVPAPHFYEARVSGIEKIDMALSLLANVRSDSRPFHFSNQGYIPVSWRRTDRFSRVTREPWVYIQDLTTRECILANTEFIMNVKKLEMTPSLNSRLEKGTDNLQILFQRTWEDLSNREKGLVHALRWLHRAREEGTNVDKLIYLWNAIEFISAPTKLQRLFSKEETKTIRKLTHNSVNNDDPKKALKAERIDELLAMLNNPSLLTQLKRLTESENIDLSKEEWEHIRKSRDKRNDIIHGRSNVVFDDDEATKLSFIVSKIISGLSLKL